MIFRFGAFHLDTRVLELHRRDKPVHIEPRVFDALRLLVENRGRVVCKDELIEHVWNGRIVSEATISTCINAVRRAVGDDGKRQEIIRTVPRRGFRFVPTVAVVDEESSTVAGEAAVTSETGTPLPEASPASPRPDSPSIAVMPFRNLGNDPSQDYLAEGIRLAVQASLVQFPKLFLIAPPALNRYNGREVSPQQVAREIGVRYVLEGAAQSAEARIRVTAQLVDATTHQVIWAERYDRELADSLTAQDDITLAIVAALDVELVGSGTPWLMSTVRNLEAVHAFYRGLTHLYAMSKNDNLTAKSEFEKVVRLQPDSPVGYAYLCISHWTEVSMGWSESRDRSLAQANEWAEKALEFDGANGMAHMVVAGSHLINRRHEEALAICSKALELRPNCPITNINFANILHYCGRSAEAIAKVKETMSIMRVYPPWFLTLLAAAYREVGDIDQSISTAMQALVLSPSDIDARLVLCSDYDITGRREEAKPIAREIVQIDPTFSIARSIENQPYRDQKILDRLVDSFRSAGLPE